jgi:hypothetical protein
MATRHSSAPSPPGGKAVGITLAQGPGRTAALTIVGVPLAIFLLIGFITAHGGGSPANAGGLTGTGLNSATPFSGTSSSPVIPATEGVTPSLSGLVPATTSPVSSTMAAPTASDTAVPSASPSATGPAATVLAAYAAINRKDYQTAYSLGLGDPQPGESLQQYAAGYADTDNVTVTITAVQGDTVTVSLDATQTDGTQQTFSGTYTVSGGHITGASIQQAN